MEGLLFRNREHWLAELAGRTDVAREAPVGDGKDDRFHRGFAVSAKMTAADFLEHGAALFAATPLEALQLEEFLIVNRTLEPTPADYPARVLESPLLERLRRLDLSWNGLGPEQAALIAASPRLRNLAIEAKGVTAAWVLALAERPTLRLCSLDLRASNSATRAQSRWRRGRG